MKFFSDSVLWLTSPRKTSTAVDGFRWNCGNDLTPGIDEVLEWQDWSLRESTPDQQRIEAFLENRNLKGTFLLHVGVGNSGFAKKFCPRTEGIDGITIQPAEVDKGRQMNIPRYRIFLLNKFSPDIFRLLGRKYDLIVDNNPSSFACCRKHFYTMLKSYCRLLKGGGLILTDKLGLGWSTQPNDPLWGLSPEDWFRIGSKFGLKPIEFSSSIIALEKPS